MVDSRSNDLLECSCHEDWFQLDVHVLGCDVFGQFSRELTRGLGQAVGRLGFGIQVRKVPLLGSTCFLSNAVPGGRVYHICSRA